MTFDGRLFSGITVLSRSRRVAVSCAQQTLSDCRHRALAALFHASKSE